MNPSQISGKDTEVGNEEHMSAEFEYHKTEAATHSVS